MLAINPNNRNKGNFVEHKLDIAFEIFLLLVVQAVDLEARNLSHNFASGNSF